MIYPDLFSPDNFGSLTLFVPAFSGGLPVVLLSSEGTLMMVSKVVNLIIFLGLLYYLLRLQFSRSS